jgi:hypothetical protein
LPVTAHFLWKTLAEQLLMSPNVLSTFTVASKLASLRYASFVLFMLNLEGQQTILIERGLLNEQIAQQNLYE